MKILTILLLYTLLASLYDLRFRRVPNWITFPLLAAGLLANFPGTTLLWGATVFLVALGFTKQSTVHSLLSPITTLLRLPASPGYVVGMGDVKLWLACLWAVPQDLSLEALVAMALGWISDVPGPYRLANPAPPAGRRDLAGGMGFVRLFNDPVLISLPAAPVLSHAVRPLPRPA